MSESSNDEVDTLPDGNAGDAGAPRGADAVTGDTGAYRQLAKDYAAWNQVTVLAGVRGLTPLFAVERGRFEMVGDEGTNRADASKRDSPR